MIENARGSVEGQLGEQPWAAVVIAVDVHQCAQRGASVDRQSSVVAAPKRVGRVKTGRSGGKRVPGRTADGSARCGLTALDREAGGGLRISVGDAQYHDGVCEGIVELRRGWCRWDRLLRADAARLRVAQLADEGAPADGAVALSVLADHPDDIRVDRVDSGAQVVSPTVGEVIDLPGLELASAAQRVQRIGGQTAGHHCAREHVAVRAGERDVQVSRGVGPDGRPGVVLAWGAEHDVLDDGGCPNGLHLDQVDARSNDRVPGGGAGGGSRRPEAVVPPDRFQEPKVSRVDHPWSGRHRKRRDVLENDGQAHRRGLGGCTERRRSCDPNHQHVCRREGREGVERRQVLVGSSGELVGRPNGKAGDVDREEEDRGGAPGDDMGLLHHQRLFADKEARNGFEEVVGDGELVVCQADPCVVGKCAAVRSGVEGPGSGGVARR